MAETDIIPAGAAEFLAEQEARIESAVAQAFVTAGEAFRVIRDEKLYKASPQDKFEDYCRERWQLDIRHVERLMVAARVMDVLRPIGRLLPKNESIARPLGRLFGPPDEEEVLQEVWGDVIERAPKSRQGEPIITAKHVEAIVKERLQPTQPAVFPGRDYRVLYADPPWKYSDTLIEGYGAADHHYPQMSIMELCKLEDEHKVHVSDCALVDAVLFMWVTSPLLQESFQVIDAWRFDYKTSFVWDKVKHNYGHYNSVRHELLLVCTRGSCTPDAKTLHDSVVSIERSGKHSEKPERFYEIIEELYPAGKRIELFARKARPNWDAYGNQLAIGDGQ